MKGQTLLLSILTVLSALSEVLSPHVPATALQPTEASKTWLNVVEEYKQKLHDDGYHKRRKKRCKRYTRNHYGGYAPPRPYCNYGYRVQSPVYLSPCYTYCYSCPTPGCRRVCPRTPAPATIIIKPATTVAPAKACNCDPNGSKYQPCDPNTGHCMCKPNYTGRACSLCKDGYWKNANGNCLKCQCNEYGAKDSNCNKTSGQCNCLTGVRGISCESCLPNYYGTVDTGCIECEPCDKKGHICGKGGKCVCPPLTAGNECERCIANAWGHQGIEGCKLCNCSTTGSVKLQCDKYSGACICKSGFEGEKCNRCSFGYYGYPNCKKCDCDPSGTAPQDCKGNSCHCTDKGICKCKKYVQGDKCDKCKNRTFGVDKENPLGCTKCFCFERSDTCIDSKYNWDKTQFQKPIDNNELLSDSDILSLPRQFLGDKTTSYGGYLTVNEKSLRDGQFSVTLIGNGLKLRSGGTINSSELKLNEKYWQITSSNNGHCRGELTRDCFMLALQNVTAIIVEGRNMEITEVLLDVAKLGLLYNRPSHTVEQCQCPPEYTGLSCQDPNEGYYRYFPKNNHWVDDVIGVARPCDCNGHSSKCDPNNGHCKNCTDNRDGKHCELCAGGYYMDHSKNCIPCLCPSDTENNAKSCVARNYDFVCDCKEGYTGVKCEKCSAGHYRDSTTNKCAQCGCNIYGSYSQTCDKNGKCSCKPGFEGQKCNKCHNEREYIKDGICVPCDECAQLLFNDIDKLTKAVEETFKLFENGIAPPWKKLTDIMEKHKMLSKKFQDKRERYEKIIKEHNITEYENKINEIESKADLHNSAASNLEKQSNDLNNSTIALANDLEKLKIKLQETINTLNSFGTTRVSIKDALKKAKKILQTMEEMIGAFERLEDEKVFKYCSDVDKRIQDVYSDKTVFPKELVDDLLQRLDDIEKITAEVAEKNAIAEDLNREHSERLERLKIKMQTVNQENDQAQNNIQEVMDKLKAINDTSMKLEKVFEDIGKFKFDDIDKLETRLKRDMESMEDMDDLFFRATKHAEELEKTVEQYKSIFNFTTDEWKTIKASGAYEDIVKGIKMASDEAKQAALILKNATNIINPSDSDDLVDKSNLAHAYSDRLKKRIANLKNMSTNFNVIKNKLEEFKYKLLENGKANNDLTQILHNIEVRITSEDGLVDKLHEAIENSTIISEKMQQIEKELFSRDFESRYDLFKKYKTYLAMISEDEMNELKKKLTYTKKELESINLSPPAVDNSKNFTKSKSNLDSIRERIKELQNKVKYARQAADSINVAMAFNNCSMTYHIPQTEIFRNLSVIYHCDTCDLFKWANGSGQNRDYLNLTVVNSTVMLNLSINNKVVNMSLPGGGGKEKRVIIERTGSLIKFGITPSKQVPNEIGNDLLTITENDDIVIGNTHSNKNSGYVYKVTLNDYNIGLWKFAEMKGECKGASRTEPRVEEEGKPFYTGNGYRPYIVQNQKPSQFSLQFTFSTFDENSLIYMAQEKDNPRAFIALYLDKGRAVLRVRHNNNQEMSLKSPVRVNDGNNQILELTMKYSGGRQTYKLNQTTDSVPLGKQHVFKIKKADQFLGGVPPTFNSTYVPNEVNLTSFLGFLSAPKLDTCESLHGVVCRSGELDFNKVWFIGNGYVKISNKIPSIGTPKLENMIFTLRPLISDGIIMNVTKFGVISLTSRRLKIEFSISGSQEVFTSSKPLIINDYNIIMIDIKKENISITINDNKDVHQTKRRFKQEDIEITIGKSDLEDVFYRGGISNIFVNKMEVLFNSSTVQSFSNVEIGREPRLARLQRRDQQYEYKDHILPNIMSNTMQNTEGCALTGNYITDSNAVQFGDKPNSFVKVKTSFWRKNYTLGFEFRTFDPNGVLFLSTGGNQHQHYNFLELKEGRLNLYIKGKRRRKESMPISMHHKVNDGKWHKLHIVKKARHLTMTLDGERSKPVRIPKNRIKNEIWLGGVPYDYTDYRELKDKLPPFRGCIKSLIINNEQQNLMKNNKDILSQNITQCFPHVEEGGYFGGDSHALYKRNFRMTESLHLGFDFKTAEQNGILMSASASNNYPAMSIELQNGAIVMRTEMGNIVSNITNNLNSEFALCDNRWHNVSARYSTTDLTVIVDGIIKMWVHEITWIDEVYEPLYIGGIPDDAPFGTLKIRQNFKGCIRNLIIEDEVIDWSDMEELNHVLLNSCPIIPGET